MPSGSPSRIPFWAQGQKFYAGIGLGAAKFSLDRDTVIASNPQLSQAATIDSSAFSLASYGGYRFDEQLAIQLEINTGASVTARDNNQNQQLFDVTLFSVSATLGGNVTESLKLYGKLGGTLWGFSKQASGSTQTASNGFGPSLGVGADVNLFGGKERQVRLEWTYHHLDKLYAKNGSSLILSALFSFPQ